MENLVFVKKNGFFFKMFFHHQSVQEIIQNYLRIRSESNEMKV